jgi:hypothetical protein
MSGQNDFKYKIISYPTTVDKTMEADDFRYGIISIDETVKTSDFEHTVTRRPGENGETLKIEDFKLEEVTSNDDSQNFTTESPSAPPISNENNQ